MTLTKILNSGKYKVLVGDPLLEDLLYKDSEVKMVKLPHVAVSSKLYWNEAVKFLSHEMEELLKQI